MLYTLLIVMCLDPMVVKDNAKFLEWCFELYELADYGRNKHEKLATITSEDNKLIFTIYESSKENYTTTAKVKVSQGDIIVHTHPNKSNPKLSSGDIKNARKIKCSIISVHSRGIYLYDIAKNQTSRIYKKSWHR